MTLRSVGDRGSTAWLACLVVCALLAGVWPAGAQTEAPDGVEPERWGQLARMSLAELLEQKIFLASRKEEPWFDSPSAVYVLDREEIRRSGATSIPELLRRVPGLHVARVNASTWAVGVRGFTRALSNKLLVQVDGRTVYSPLFAGVYWDIQQPVLEDIERIEVIRGPGASLWGANAVNGIINIVTRSARDTHGLLLDVAAGTEERLLADLRYGGAIGESVHYRFYTNHIVRDDFVEAKPLAGGPPNVEAFDGWRFHQGGLRLDWEPGDHDRVTLLGAYYNGELREAYQALVDPVLDTGLTSFTDNTDVSGGNVLLRWDHRFAGGSQLIIQTYYDRTDRLRATNEEWRDTVDLDLQYRFQLTRRQELTCGFRFNHTDGRTRPGVAVDFDPRSRRDDLYSGFILDEIRLLDERLRIQLGTKLEHNDFTGWEIQPSIHVGWQPHAKHFLWGAISRAVRVPSVSDHDIQIDVVKLEVGDPPEPVLLRSLGSREVDSERLLAFELGYRVQLPRRAMLDLALFYNRYDTLASSSFGEEETDPDTGLRVLPSIRGDDSEGETWGVEIAGLWDETDSWRLMTSLSYQDTELQTFGAVGSRAELLGVFPTFMAFAGSRFSPLDALDLDASLYYVDRLSDLGVSSYVRLDARIAWRPLRWLELSLVGRNLLEAHHAEFASQGSIIATEPQRDVYVKATIRWDPH
jgi:iron complex outermembrane receptor protein